MEIIHTATPTKPMRSHGAALSSGVKLGNVLLSEWKEVYVEDLP